MKLLRRRSSRSRLKVLTLDRSWLVLGALLAALLAAPVAARAQELAGRIVGVIDGDTVDLLTASKDLIRVRLSGIDAPEKGQPFGQVAKRTLSDIVFDRQVVVDGTKRDRYGRLVGKLLVGGSDANLQIVARGLAWHFKRYEREQPEADRTTYAHAEAAARAGHLGLWADRQPVAPWDYRAHKRQGDEGHPAETASTKGAIGSPWPSTERTAP